MMAIGCVAILLGFSGCSDSSESGDVVGGQATDARASVEATTATTTAPVETTIAPTTTAPALEPADVANLFVHATIDGRRADAEALFRLLGNVESFDQAWADYLFGSGGHEVVFESQICNPGSEQRSTEETGDVELYNCTYETLPYGWFYLELFREDGQWWVWDAYPVSGD
jgi:hypothetical protein